MKILHDFKQCEKIVKVHELKWVSSGMQVWRPAVLIDFKRRNRIRFLDFYLLLLQCLLNYSGKKISSGKNIQSHNYLKC